MRRVSGGRLAVAMLVGVLGAALGLALDAVIAYLREDWTNPIGIFGAVALASIGGAIPLLQESKPEPAPPPPPDPRGWPPPYRPPVRRPGRVPVLAAVLVLLLVCGGGAALVGYGAQYAGGWVTGDEDGADVLVEPRSAKSGPLTLTVRRVLLTRHFTRVDMTAQNTGEVSLTLPVYGYCQLNPRGGTTLEGDAFRSDWPDTVPAEGTINGTVVFDRVPDGTSRVNVSFTQIFGPGGKAITVRDVALSLPAA